MRAKMQRWRNYFWGLQLQRQRNSGKCSPPQKNVPPALWVCCKIQLGIFVFLDYNTQSSAISSQITDWKLTVSDYKTQDPPDRLEVG